MPMPACRPACLFTLGTAAPVGGVAGIFLISYMDTHTIVVKVFLTNLSNSICSLKVFKTAVHITLTIWPPKRIIMARIGNAVLKPWTGGVGLW